MGDPAIYTQDFTRGLPGVSAMLPGISSLWVYLYWTVGLLAITMVAYLLYTVMNRQVAGTLFWIMGFLLVYFYYVKWFVMGRKKKDAGNFTKCPDYLTQYVMPGSPDGTTKPKSVCLDFVGVSSNGTIKKCEKEPSECMKDPQYVFTPPTTKSLADYRDAAAAAGLIWSSVLGDV